MRSCSTTRRQSTSRCELAPVLGFVVKGLLRLAFIALILFAFAATAVSGWFKRRANV
ncbi:hypothetical protein QFZ35_001053 [Arthrobacter ulcerisalmonis]|nr:hypothetical protein [Arthrobacter ulcerisalmonis]